MKTSGRTNPERPLRILRIDSSGRTSGSTTRMLGDRVIDELRAEYGAVTVTARDVASGLPFVDGAWIEANFTDPTARNSSQQAALSCSDTLVEEIKDAEVLVIGVPVYNFGVPAALKAWIDLVARARLTFRYTESGPEGLVKGTKAYLVVASGGVAVDGPNDFATPYIRHALAFLGITDVEVVAADRQSIEGDDAVERARRRIRDVVGRSAAPLRMVAG